MGPRVETEFSKDKKDSYYLLKMCSSEGGNDGKIDIFTSEGKCAVLLKDNYSGQNETPGRRTVVLPYHGENTSDHKSMSGLKNQGEIPTVKRESANKAKLRSASSPASNSKRGRRDKLQGLGISRGKDQRVKRTSSVSDGNKTEPQDPIRVNLFETKFNKKEVPKVQMKIEDLCTFPINPYPSN